ncbi:MAG: hypothetical protein CMJ22_07900 [Phycisphaerae bacterium]|nr:hypothetical protein [Phycisphaerae bacterium]
MEVISSIDAIRAAWRPLNEAHRAGRRFSDGAHLRLYRCLSWADRATAAEATGDADLAFVLRMIAFNALWGQVHVDGGRNLRQSEAWRSFLVDLAAHDAARRDRMLPGLRRDRDLLMEIYGSPFFHREWWVEPGAEQLGSQTKIAGRIDEWLELGRVEHLYRELVNRLLLLRGQLIHGNATHGGKTNRSTVEPAAALLDRLLRTTLEVIVLDGGLEADLRWTPVPYPPTDDA